MNPYFHLAAAALIAVAGVSGSAEAQEAAMTQDVQTLQFMYDRFNAKDIDGVLSMLSEDIQWANGMDGGYVRGHEGIREYWTRQWSVVDPHVKPLAFTPRTDGGILVTVDQTIRDLDGKPVEEKGLKDRKLGHLFHFEDGKVVRFDIAEGD